MLHRLITPTPRGERLDNLLHIALATAFWLMSLRAAAHILIRLA